MTDKETTLAQMDDAARQAKEDFTNAVILEGGTAKAVGQWVDRWYLSAGYKRLCQIIMIYARN
jgi:hypothetical protein